MIERFQDWMITKVGSDKAYYATIALYTSLILFTLALNGWLFDNWCMVITASIIINILRFFTGGFHCHVLENCIILTNTLMVVFGYIAKVVSDKSWIILFLISLFSIKDIYSSVPVTETDCKDKSIMWHKKNSIKIVIVLLLCVITLAEFGKIFIVKNILLSIIVVDILLFENSEGV